MWSSNSLCIVLSSLLTGDFRQLVDVNFVCAMGPPGGGRNPVTQRLMRHFNFLAFTDLEDSSKAKIFGTILNWWLRENYTFIYLMFMLYFEILCLWNYFKTFSVHSGLSSENYDIMHYIFT